MIERKLPDGTVLAFPDGTDTGVIQAKIKEYLYDGGPGAHETLAKDTASGIGGFLQTGAIKTGEGLFKIGRALGLAEPADEAEKKALAALEKERPVVSAVGEMVGEAMPFAPISPSGPATLAGKVGLTGLQKILSSTLAKATISGGIGATEGVMVAKGEGKDGLGQTTAEGIGGSIAFLSEIIFPRVSRLGGQIVRRVTGRAPKSTILTPDGLPTQELQEVLERTGLSFEDLTQGALESLANQPAGINLAQAQRIARFDELGLPYTRGDITKDFIQQAQEARLVDSAADLSADPLRHLRIEQSDKLTQKIHEMVDKAGVAGELGDSLKQALSGRDNILGRRKNALYKKAAQEAEKIEFLPFPVDNIKHAIPDAKTFRRIERYQEKDVQKLKDLLTEFGIETNENSLSRLASKGIEPEPLNLANYDDFRTALNEVMDYSYTQPNKMAVLVGPIKDALDRETDSLVEVLGKNHAANKKVIAPLKKARETAFQQRTEFSPSSITGRLIKPKSDGVSQVIEASKVYESIVGTNKAIEPLERVVESLKKSGSQGRVAMGNLQAATIMDLLDSSLKAQTRRINNVQILSPPGFTKRFQKIGDDKLKLIFQSNPEGYRQLKKISKVMEDLTVDGGAVPKGSASVNMDALLTILRGIPGAGGIIGRVAGGMATLAKMGGNRVDVAKAMRVKPEIEYAYNYLDMVAPSILAAWGIEGLTGGNDEGN